MPKLTVPENAPRLYESRGGPVPGVTSCIKFLEDKTWMNAYIARNGRASLDASRDDAAALGTRIHTLAQEIAWRRGAFAEAGMESYADAVREFYDAHVRTVVHTELALVSERERVGGTLDAYVELSDGSMAVIDIKCKKSAGVTDVNRVQTAGYGLLLKDHGYGVDKRVVLRIHTSEEKRGRWYAKSAPDHEGDERAFRACVELWWFRHGRAMRKAKA